MIYKIGDVISPILIYYLIVNIVVLIFGGTMDVAWLTTITGVLALFFLIMLYRKDRRKVAQEQKTAAWWGYLLAALLGAVCNWGFSVIMNLLAVTDHFSNEAQESLLAGELLIQVIGIGVIVPIMEEVLFRGLVYNRLKKYVPQKAALLLGAAMFALYHGNVIQMLFAFPMAIIMICLYEKWKVLTIPIVFHIASNLFAIFVAAAG